MSDRDLTIDDLMVLCEAMESWENKDDFGAMMGSLMGSILFDKKDEAARAEYERVEEENKRKVTESKRQRKERSILLRAKLIQMADSLRAERLVQQ